MLDSVYSLHDWHLVGVIFEKCAGEHSLDKFPASDKWCADHAVGVLTQCKIFHIAQTVCVWGWEKGMVNGYIGGDALNVLYSTCMLILNHEHLLSKAANIRH